MPIATGCKSLACGPALAVSPNEHPVVGSSQSHHQQTPLDRYRQAHHQAAEEAEASRRHPCPSNTPTSLNSAQPIAQSVPPSSHQWLNDLASAAACAAPVLIFRAE